MTPVTPVLIFISVTLSALAQWCFKVGVSGEQVRLAMRDGSVYDQVLALLFNPPVLLGLGMYGFGTVLWLGVLSRVELSQAYPSVGLGFILTALIGYFAFNETFGSVRLAGTVLVVAGVYLVAKG
jgi:multidrug transporter EmrE-like cation transporter